MIVVETVTVQSGGAPPVGAVGDGGLEREGFRERRREVRGVARQREPLVTGSGSVRDRAAAEGCVRKRSERASSMKVWVTRVSRKKDRAIRPPKG